MRPNWHEYFIGLAHAVSMRSHDIQTQHGCVITDSSNRILGVGYNGFPKGVDDSKLPNIRPDKYPWMIHAERNALSNCTIRPDNGIAYVTGQCCNDCIMSLHQEGIKKVYMRKNHGTFIFDEEHRTRFDLFVQMSQINIEYIDPDLSWIQNIKL
jgi:deoxycytidylate deaminase